MGPQKPDAPLRVAPPRGTAMADADDLIKAVQKNDAIKVREFLAKDANLILTKTKDGSLLQTAVYYGSKDVVKTLIPRFPQMTIYEACAVGDATRLRRVLEKGADLAARDDAGKTPLAYAIEGKHEAVALLLRERGAAA